MKTRGWVEDCSHRCVWVSDVGLKARGVVVVVVLEDIVGEMSSHGVTVRRMRRIQRNIS